MRESATLHFDLSHLTPDQSFTLRAGQESCVLQRHTPQSLTRARRDNKALRLIKDRRITHFAQPTALPDKAPMLLRVTAAKRNPDDLLDRLALVSLYLPRRHRATAIKLRRRRRPHDERPVLHPKLVALRDPDDPPGQLPSDQDLIDLGDMNTAMDAAAALIFHHGELMTLNGVPAADIINNYILYAAGINALANSIYEQAQAHEADPSQPNWVQSVPGTDWTTGQPDQDHPIYTWSDQTLEYLALPLRDSLKQTKNEPDLKNQCWTVLPGVTQVPLPVAPSLTASAADGEATYTVTAVTPQSGVSHTFAFDPSNSMPR